MWREGIRASARVGHHGRVYSQQSVNTSKTNETEGQSLGDGEKGTGTCPATDYLVLCCGQHVDVQTTELVEEGAVDRGDRGTVVCLGAFRVRGSINERTYVLVCFTA